MRVSTIHVGTAALGCPFGRSPKVRALFRSWVSVTAVWFFASFGSAEDLMREILTRRRLRARKEHATLFRRRRHVLFRQNRSLPKEELLQLLDDHFLILAPRRIQAVFVHQHLAMVCPHLPGLLRNIVVNLAPQVVIERRLIQPGQFLLQLHAKNSVRHNLPWGNQIRDQDKERKVLSYLEPVERRGRAALLGPRKPFSTSGGLQPRWS